MEAREISDLTLDLSQGIRNGDEGYLFGAPDQEVTGVVVTWKATLAAVRFAAAKGCNMLVTHEFLYDFEYTLPQPAYLQDAVNWKANMARQNYLKNNSLIVYHWHGGMLRVRGVVERYREVFGLRKMKTTLDYGSPDPCFYLPGMIGDLKEPFSLGRLANQTKKQLKLQHVRIIGDARKKIKRVGIGAGGEMLFTNMSSINYFANIGVDAVIGGESDAYAANFMMDSGLALIETDHPATDNIAVRVCYEAVKRHLPDVPVEYYEHPSPWTYV